ERAVTVTGDTGYDQVWARAQKADHSSPLLRPLSSPRPTIVAGSTWPADEAVLLTAFSALRRVIPAARLIIAPHEPTPGHLASVEQWANSGGLRLDRLEVAGSSTDVILVDRVGVLGDVYALGDVRSEEHTSELQSLA